LAQVVNFELAPTMVLARCEWGHDDYSLNVANLPMAKPDPVSAADDTAKKTKTRKAAPANTNQGGLFEQNAGENN
jgi:adenine-specific DNA-methyltransferase